MIAKVLDDRSLRLGYHDAATGRFREPDGGELTPPPSAARLAWVPVDRDDQPVAAMVIDETLAEDPELVRSRVGDPAGGGERSPRGRAARHTGAHPRGWPRRALAHRARPPRPRAAAPRRAADSPLAGGGAARSIRGTGDGRAPRRRGRRRHRRAAHRRARHLSADPGPVRGRRGARGRRPPFGDAHRHPGRWARPPLAGGRDVLWRLLCAAWPTVAAQLH